MVRMYAAGFLPGALLVLLIETVLTIVFAVGENLSATSAHCVALQLICFSDQFDEWKKSEDDSSTSTPVRHTFGFWVFCILTAFVVAGTTEESLKCAKSTESFARQLSVRWQVSAGEVDQKAARLVPRLARLRAVRCRGRPRLQHSRGDCILQSPSADC